jgi:AcrR family transcriptional regulator
MPRTKEQNEVIRAGKRQLIMDTALQLFAETGYVATSIDKIAKQAGISKGLLYNYFKSKEELLQTIMNALIAEFADAIDPNHDGIITDEEAEGFIDVMFDILIHKKDEMKLYYQLSFQAQVLDFFYYRLNVDKAAAKYYLMMQYFSKRLPCPDEKMAFLTITSYLKGLFMVYSFSSENYPNDFLMDYKAYLKEIFLNKRTNN